ncbi:MAG: MarR family transcriptional regulator [Leptospirales bacterium]|nr:MarR family transcriptional regulator [Leptospirales bacterium]
MSQRPAILYLASKLRQEAFRLLERELSRRGLQDLAPAHGDLLFVLLHSGPLTMMELARRTRRDKSTVSALVEQLATRGFVLRRRDAEDGRRVVVDLGARARKAAPELMRISAAMNRRMLQGFSAAELTQLSELLLRALRNLESE